MKYISTRGGEEVSGSQAIIKGIADDGGLYVPKSFPRLGQLEDLKDLGYKELATLVLGLYFNELEDEMKGLVDLAYDGKFPSEVVPIHTINKGNFLELFWGPTSAFKDMALCVLPHLLTSSIRNSGEKDRVLILVATSGDTGKAALEGFKDVDGVDIMIFYPNGGVSEIQRLQMATQEGKNTYVYAIEGNFDDAQTSVKGLFTDPDLEKTLADHAYKFSSANSINIGRLIPQVVYYIHGYFDLVKKGQIQLGDEINVVVPTGNFGNILASYYAKEMGLPIDKFIVASNDNHILTDFFNTGEYDSNRELLLTSSPSMDILVSSNLERLLYHVAEDKDQVGQAMKDLEKDKYYKWDQLPSNFYGGFADEDDIEEAIKTVKEDYDYTMDPHTAVAYHVYKDYVEKTGDDKPTLIASTASPYKFMEKVLKSLGEEVPADDFAALELLEKISGVEVPKNLPELKDKEELHKDIIKTSQMEEVILKLVEGL